MPAKPASPRIGRIFTIALLGGFIGAFCAIVIGISWFSYNDPESNIAPVLAFVWFAPIAFVVVFSTIFTVGLAREIPWRDASGVSVARQLLRGHAPLSVAFSIPLALLICLWFLTIFGRTLVYYQYYPLFMAIVMMVQVFLSIVWTWMTWRNAKNSTSPVKSGLAQAVSLLYTVNLLAGLAISFFRA